MGACQGQGGGWDEGLVLQLLGEGGARAVRRVRCPEHCRPPLCRAGHLKLLLLQMMMRRMRRRVLLQGVASCQYQ